MASELDICNLALLHLGTSTLQTLNDGSENAKLLQLQYDNCRRSVLRDFPWAFADVISPLVLSTAAGMAYDYCYAYPLNCLNIKKITNTDLARIQRARPERRVEFNIGLADDGRSKLIYTDLENASAEYTYDVRDTTVFDSLFIESLSYKIAFELSRVVTADAALSQELLQRYQISLSSAQHTNAVERYEHIEYPSSFLDARKGLRIWPLNR